MINIRNHGAYAGPGPSPRSAQRWGQKTRGRSERCTCFMYEYVYRCLIMRLDVSEVEGDRVRQARHQICAEKLLDRCRDRGNPRKCRVIGSETQNSRVLGADNLDDWISG